MAVRLDAWLADTLEWQLVLGNHWLQERHEQKKSGVKTEHDRAWEGLYHDNGSCLEITNDIHSERNSALQVLETQPWTLTDGKHRLVAHLTPDCAQRFAAQHPTVSYLSPGCTFAVRKYTIQYTSYGPPSHRLRFVLHHIEWLGVSCPTASDLITTDLVPLYHQGAIRAVQGQLRETRARQDCCCLSVGQAQGNETMAGDVPDSGHQSASQNLHSQLALATQSPFENELQYWNRRRAAGSDEPVIVAERSREPILAGNTKRVERRREESATLYEEEQALLKLIANQNQETQTARRNRGTAAGPSSGRPRGQPPTQYPNWTQFALARPKPTDKVAEPSLEQPREPSNHDTHRSGEEHQHAEDESPPPPIQREGPGRNASSQVSGRREVKDSIESRGDSAAPECSWMKGFIFNSETLKVSRLQQQCLSKDTSWLHPPPGCPPFQDGNMPQSILEALHRIADELASAEDDDDSDDESDINPSPNSQPVVISLSAESVPQTTQDDDDDDEGRVSWAPTPEPPQRPSKPYQDLPPDSSPVVQNRLASPHLAVQNLVISDDEMEMEESIPQALGEDLTEKAASHTNITAVSSPRSTQPQSVVQVRETPYKKGKTAQPTDKSPFRKPDLKQTQTPNDAFEDTSSAIIVSSIEHDPRAPDNSSGKEVSDMPPNTTPEPLQSHGLVSESSLNTPQAVSRSTKRKLQTSPAKANRRQPKRREILLVGFGDMSPPTVDPVTRLREEREESLRRFREQRNSSISFEGPYPPTRAPMNSQGMDSMDLDSADMPDNERQSDRRSPRHESLYEEPTPRPSRPTEIAQSRPLHKDSQSRGQPTFSQATQCSSPNFQTQYTSAVSDEEGYATVFDFFKAAYPEYKGNSNHFHNLCKQMYKWNLEDKMVPKWQWDDFMIRNRTDYMDYATACLDSGEHPEPYLRYYKDNIRDTLYRRGILEGRETLEQALEEVGIAVEDLDPPADPPSRPSSSRKSLANPFTQTRTPRYSFGTASQNRPRQSLPSSSYAQQQYHRGTPAASRHQTPRQQMRPPPRPSQLEPPDDPFRKFYFSVRDGDKVDSSKS